MLITLAIIGVVAALTIPVVVANYQKKAYYTAFMKTYNTIVTALDLSIAENGTPDTWAFDPHNPQESIKKYIMPYLKVNKTCSADDVEECVSSTLTFLTNQDPMPASDIWGDTLLLADGSALTIHEEYGTVLDFLNFIFDTNGKKGPNIAGRDIFAVTYSMPSATKKWTWDYNYEKGGRIDGSGYVVPSNCDIQSSYEFNGEGCAGRLIEEGAMNY